MFVGALDDCEYVFNQSNVLYSGDVRSTSITSWAMADGARMRAIRLLRTLLRLGSDMLEPNFDRELLSGRRRRSGAGWLQNNIVGSGAR